VPGLLRLAAFVAVLTILTGCSLPLATASPSPTPQVARSADIPGMDAREAAHPNPDFDFGHTVQFTTEGFHPSILVAACCAPITWQNLTNAPVTVVFDHQLVSSGPIPTGGIWTYTPPTMGSFTYHAVGHPDLHGAVQVNQTFES